MVFTTTESLLSITVTACLKSPPFFEAESKYLKKPDIPPSELLSYEEAYSSKSRKFALFCLLFSNADATAKKSVSSYIFLIKRSKVMEDE